LVLKVVRGTDDAGFGGIEASPSRGHGPASRARAVQ
jgi:hypothetical protein